MRVAGKEHEGNAPGRQDGADRKTRPAIEVDVEDRAVEGPLASHLYSAFQPANRSNRHEAALAQKLGDEVRDQQVVVADEYAASMPRTTVPSQWLPHTFPPKR